MNIKILQLARRKVKKRANGKIDFTSVFCTFAVVFFHLLLCLSIHIHTLLLFKFREFFFSSLLFLFCFSLLHSLHSLFPLIVGIMYDLWLNIFLFVHTNNFRHENISHDIYIGCMNMSIFGWAGVTFATLVGAKFVENRFALLITVYDLYIAHIFRSTRLAAAFLDLLYSHRMSSTIIFLFHILFSFFCLFEMPKAI